MVFQLKNGLERVPSGGLLGVLCAGLIGGLGALCCHSVLFGTVRAEPERPASEAVAGTPVLLPDGVGGSYTVIDRGEYGRQVAVAVLIGQYHDISDDEVRFVRDGRREGSALQQFAEVFGAAISDGAGPGLQPQRRNGRGGQVLLSRDADEVESSSDSGSGSR